MCQRVSANGAGAKGAGAKGAGALIILALSLSCQQSARVSDCQWRQSVEQPRALLDDIRLAEDMAIRFADAQGYQSGWRETRESCESSLFAGLAAARGVTVADVAAARRQLDQRGFDWLVNIPVAVACLFAGLMLTRRVARHFGGEFLPSIVAIVIASIGLAVVVVILGQVWAAIIEMLRIGNGHLSYRAFRIPWSHHRPQAFALAVFAVWCLGLIQLFRSRSGTPSRSSGPRIGATVLVVFSALWCSEPVYAQTVHPLATDWLTTTRSFWQVDVGYPVRAGLGASLVAGQERRLNGYESKLRGILFGVDAGLTALSARIGWASFHPTDAAMSGYSTEFLVARPHGMESRLDRGTTYAGVTMSYYWSAFRFSGGALVGGRGNEKQIVPVATVAILVPFR